MVVKDFVDLKEEDIKVEVHDESIANTDVEVKFDAAPVWVEDDTVPPGWRLRLLPEGASKFNTFFLAAPDGRQFHSRQAALHSLLKKENPQDIGLIDELRSLLVHEGWKEHPLLPPGWSFRDGAWALEVLNHKGMPFKGLSKAKKFIERTHDEMTAVNFAMFVEIQSAERRGDKYDWQEDGSLPEGWKMRTAEGKMSKKFFLSPDCQQFASRRLGYQHLIKEQFDEDHIEDMRLCLIRHEGWTEKSVLPINWLFKKDARQAGSKAAILFLTSEGKMCKSFISAVEHMRTLPALYYNEHISGKSNHSIDVAR